MRKITILVAAFMMAGILSACGNNNVINSGNVEKIGNAGKISIVTTAFPEYDWVRQILGDKVEDADITMLLDNGVDLHSYQPTADDLVKISNCDMFIYVGGESDEWVKDVLGNVANKEMESINLLETLGDAIKTEEAVAGMQSEEGHNHGVSDFEDSDVEDRSLADWEGDWQSVYPYILDGALDQVMECKAQEGDKTAEEYKQSCMEAYETDIVDMHIEGNTILYAKEGKSESAEYEYAGFYIQNKGDGTKEAKYQFKKSSGDKEAPTYIVLSDYHIFSAKPEHFCMRYGDEGFDSLVEEEGHGPTFYPSDMSGADISKEMLEHEEREYDEHIWLSLGNAEILCGVISEKLAEIDPKHASDYKNNAAVYQEKLEALDEEYRSAINHAAQKTLLFGDRFPFRYLADDYGLSYYAAFSGCSAETEASFETITFLAGKVDELGLHHVLTIEKSDQKIAQTIVQSTQGKDQQILALDSMQSTTSADVSNGATYLSVMESNLDVLKEALE